MSVYMYVCVLTIKQKTRVVVTSIDQNFAHTRKMFPMITAGDIIYKVGRQLTIALRADDVLRELKTVCTNKPSSGVPIIFWRRPTKRMSAAGLRKSLVHLPAIIKWRGRVRKFKGKKASSRPPLKKDTSGCHPMHGHLSMKSGLGYATGRRYFKLLNGKLNFANNIKDIENSNKLRGSVNLYQVASVVRIKTEIELKFSVDAHEQPLKLKANGTDKAKTWFSAIKERCDWLRT